MPYRLAISLNGVNDGTRTHDNQCHKLALYQLNYVHHMVRVKRFELLAHALEGRCSIQLSYAPIFYYGAGNEIRTRDFHLGKVTLYH